MDIEAEIDRLYTLPLSEFVDARKRLAAQVRGHDREAAERIKKLAKPSLSAWAVNQAYWQERGAFEAMLDAAEAWRSLQKQALTGERDADWHERMQDAMAAEREARAVLLKSAERALADDELGQSPAMSRRVATTLEALAAHGRRESAPRPGRLVADVPPPGFEALADLAGALPPPRPRLVVDTARPRTMRARHASTHEAPRAAEPAAPQPELATPRAAQSAPAAQSADAGKAPAPKLRAAQSAPAAQSADVGKAPAPKLPSAPAAPAAQSADAGKVPASTRRRSSSTANDNAPPAAHDIRASARAARERDRLAARQAVTRAQARLEPLRRTLARAEKAERVALDQVYAAERAVTLAQEALARAVAERERALRDAETTKAHVESARAEVAEAEAALHAAERARDAMD